MPDPKPSPTLQALFEKLARIDAKLDILLCLLSDSK
jgi:hypothetical protein